MLLNSIKEYKRRKKMEPKKQNEQENEIQKKRESREEEAMLADGYLYFLIRLFGFSVKIKQTKYSEKNVKLYLVDEFFIQGGMVITQEDIRREGKKLQERFGAIQTTEHMNQKQEKRSKEAEMSNGYLQMLMNAGYIPEFKGTRSAKKTIKMYKIKSMRTPTNIELDKEIFITFGKRLDMIIKKRFALGERLLLLSTNSLIEEEEQNQEKKLIDYLDPKIKNNTHEEKKQLDDSETEDIYNSVD